jgi:ribonuclease HI
MTYKKEEVLRAKAQAFVEYLRDNGLSAHIKADGFRDYSAKVLIDTRGAINLYTNEKETSFTIKLNELLDRTLAEEIETHWRAFLQGQSQQVAGYQAYVDGSYRDGRVSFGAIILKDGTEAHRISGQVTEGVETRQVAGEITAVIRVLEWCAAQGISEIEIFYDYDGLAQWATGAWRQNSVLTKQYARSVAESPTKIRWQKVKSHSGNSWNEAADTLARRVLEQSDSVAAIEHTDITGESVEYAEVEYYLTKLEPYRHLAFDFSVLTQAIARSFPQRDLDLSRYKFDYDALARRFMELKGG